MHTDVFQPSSTNIVLGHPFSGALYAYFDKELTHGTHAAASKHLSYYKTLYGRHYKDNMDVAITLSLIYDNVILVAADNALPDHGKYLNKVSTCVSLCPWQCKITDYELFARLLLM